MALGIFLLLSGILFGLGAIYDEIKAIRKALENGRPTPSSQGAGVE